MAKKPQGSSQHETRGGLIRTRLYRMEMVILTCSVIEYVYYQRSEGCTREGSQAQEGNEDASCRRDVLAKSLSMEEMSKEVLSTKF